jgi:branched-chain amino acid transport system substrate-binding protein
MTARDRMQHHDAWIDPATHQVQQTIYMATYNDKPAEPDDIFKVLSQVAPAEIVDQDAPKTCKMASSQETPSYEQ